MKTWSVQHPVQGRQVEQLDVVELYSTAACHQPASYLSRLPCGGPYPSLKELSFILTAGTVTLYILETDNAGIHHISSGALELAVLIAIWENCSTSLCRQVELLLLGQ